jgi:hypothetical protein
MYSLFLSNSALSPGGGSQGALSGIAVWQLILIIGLPLIAIAIAIAWFVRERFAR